MHYKKYILAASLLFSVLNIQAHYPHHHQDTMFAANVSRAELMDAYVSKCSENYHLTKALYEAKKHNYQWKDIQKAFGIGAAMTFGAMLSLYFYTR